MKKLIIALFALSQLSMTQISHAEVSASNLFATRSVSSPIFVATNDSTHSLNATDPVPTSESAETIKSDSSASTGGVLLSILAGVAIGAVIYSLTKQDYVSTTPTSQGTINMNR